MNNTSSSQPRPNPEEIKKEAQKLLHGLKLGDAAALKRYQAFQPWVRIPEPSIEDAQYIIARELGYASWQKLMEHLDSGSGSNPT